jgi:molybdenum cofactor synthesis domain-containing protein
VLTVSDRSAAGERPDLSGDRIRQRLERDGWQVARTAVVPDEAATIEDTLRSWADSGEVDVLLTTGGTGFGPRDVTPEATLRVVERRSPGLAEAMRVAGLQKTPHAMLSRGVAGIRGRTLIVNLPGSPTAAIESLQVILPALPHAVQLLQGDPRAEAGHRPPKRPVA